MSSHMQSLWQGPSRFEGLDWATIKQLGLQSTVYGGVEEDLELAAGIRLVICLFSLHDTSWEFIRVYMSLLTFFGRLDAGNKFARGWDCSDTTCRSAAICSSTGGETPGQQWNEATWCNISQMIINVPLSSPVRSGHGLQRVMTSKKRQEIKDNQLQYFVCYLKIFKVCLCPVTAFPTSSRTDSRNDRRRRRWKKYFVM